MNTNEKVSSLIADIKQRRLRRLRHNNLGKMEKQQELQNPINLYHIDIGDFELIIRQIKKNEYPTPTILKEIIKEGVRKLYNNHVYTHGQLTHDCCFSEYQSKILQLIDIVMSKEFMTEMVENIKS